MRRKELFIENVLVIDSELKNDLASSKTLSPCFFIFSSIRSDSGSMGKMPTNEPSFRYSLIWESKTLYMSTLGYEW